MTKDKETRGQIIVGLGNPGVEHENTYHNVGWLAVDALIHSLSPDTPPAWLTHKNLFEYALIGETVFIKPLTYMNDSGKAVREAVKKFRVSLSSSASLSSSSPVSVSPRLLVIHDDSDLTIGNYKISFARGAAGHKGVQSIIDALKTNAFTRVRIGIRPAHEKKRQKAGDFALKQITKSDRASIEKVFASASLRQSA